MGCADSPRTPSSPNNPFVRRRPPQFPAPRHSWPTTECRRSRLVNVSVESRPPSYDPSGVLTVGDGESRWFCRTLHLVYKPRCSYCTYLRFELVNTHDYTSSSVLSFCDSEFRSRPRRPFGVVVADKQAARLKQKSSSGKPMLGFNKLTQT